MLLTAQYFYCLWRDTAIFVPQKRPVVGEPIKVVFMTL